MREQQIHNLISDINDLLDLQYDDLREFHFIFNNWYAGEKKQIQGTSNICVHKDPNRMRFITEIPPLLSFDTHWHDCLERCTILSGRMRDKLNPVAEWNRDDVAEFKPFQKHKPWNPSDKSSLFVQVDFFK